MTEMAIPKTPTNARRWYPSTYVDQTQPSLLFRLTAGLLVVAWLVLTGWVVVHITTVGSPDEAANHLFIGQLATTGQYRLDTGLPADIVGYLHPRSISVQGQFLAPGSFLGLVQAGAAAQKVFGPGAEKMITPLLALAGLIAMFFLFRRFWSRWWSLLGAVLIALHPAFFTYAVLPYIHNGAFVAVLMVAALATMWLLEVPTWWKSVLVGLAYGGALFFRPVEVLWSAPAVAILLVARKMWRELFIVALTTLAMQLPWLLTDRTVYGSWLSSGYTPSGVFTDAVGSEAVTAPAKTILTPPGGLSWHWLSSTWWYFVLLVPIWSALAVVAISRYFRKKYVTWSKSVKLSVVTFIGIFPLVYYGGWNLYPTTPAADVGALASYVRYWLPLYVVMAPGVVIILKMIRARWVVVSTFAVLLISQIATIWLHPVSGLQARLSASTRNSKLKTAVLMATEPDSVIIAGSADKYFQDQRLSTFRLPQNVAQWQALRTLVSLRPVYVYVAVGAVDTDQAQVDLATNHLRMDQKATFGRDILWQLHPTS